METACVFPPACCVIIEMEQGASIGYRRAVLLSEIQALGSLAKAAKTSRIPVHHAWELVRKMNSDFSRPLVAFVEQADHCDGVHLTQRGEEIIRSYWQQFEPVWQDIQMDRSRHY